MALRDMRRFEVSDAYRFERCTVSLAAANLTDRRDSILPSELGKGQLYRMPRRRVPADIRVEVVSFDSQAHLIQQPTLKRNDAIEVIDSFQPRQATAIGSAMLVSLTSIFPGKQLNWRG